MTIDNLIAQISTTLESFKVNYTGLNLRQRVLCLVDVLKSTRKLNIQVVRDSGCDARGARERIRLYLVANAGITIDAEELEVVSGISEYGRRIRELRVQDGYRIVTGASNDPDAGINLRPDQYLLTDPEPDREAAYRWHIANRIRREGGGAQDRILHYLQANVGKVVTGEELRYVADVTEFGRRTRELRTEQGYAIATRFTGRPDLRAGEYILENLDRTAPPHDRNIPEDVQKAVYGRDNHTCQYCGWNHEMWTREDPRFLELHHLEEHAQGGKNTEDNLLVLCNRCHDDVHAKRIKISRPGHTKE